MGAPTSPRHSLTAGAARGEAGRGAQRRARIRGAATMPILFAMHTGT